MVQGRRDPHPCEDPTKGRQVGKILIPVRISPALEGHRAGGTPIPVGVPGTLGGHWAGWEASTQPSIPSVVQQLHPSPSKSSRESRAPLPTQAGFGARKEAGIELLCPSRARDGSEIFNRCTPASAELPGCKAAEPPAASHWLSEPLNM